MTYQLVEADFRAVFVEHEPSSVATNSCQTDVCSNNHVSEEEPAADKRVVTLSRRTVHDIVILGVEAERSSGKTVGDQVDPKKLDGNQSLGHADGSSEEDRDNLANVRRDQVADELLSVVVNAATLLDGRLDRGEVVIGKNHVGGELSDISTGTHGDTDVTLLERRSVVHTVTSHGNNLTSGLQKIDKLALVSRLSTGEERSGAGSLELISFTKSIELTTSVALAGEIFIGTKDTNLSADSLGSVLVVTGDDDDTNTSVAALDDAVCDLRTGRVEHTNKTEKSHALFKLRVLLGSLCALGQIGRNIVDACECHDTKTLLAVLDNFSVQERSQLFGERDTLAVAANKAVRAAIEDRFGCTLDKQTLALATVDEYGHALAVSRELEGPELLRAFEIFSAGEVTDLFGGESRFGLVECGVGGTDLLCECTQSTLSGLTNVVVVSSLAVPGELGIVADSSDFGHLSDGSGGGGRVFNDLSSLGDCAHRCEAGALDVELLEVVASLVHVDDLVHAHLVGGESTGLVGANDTAASESLDGGQATNDGVLLGHSLGSECQTGGDDNRETFGNGGNTERDGDLEVVDGALGPVAAERGIVEVTDVDQPNENTDSGDDLGQAVTEIVQLLLKRCRL